MQVKVTREALKSIVTDKEKYKQKGRKSSLVCMGKSVKIFSLAGRDNPVCGATAKKYSKGVESSPYGYVVKVGAETPSERGIATLWKFCHKVRR